MVPLPDDEELRVNSMTLIDGPPDILIATTGIGFRGWISATEDWGVAGALLDALAKARIVFPRPQGDRRTARGGLARRVVAGIRVVARGAQLPAAG